MKQLNLMIMVERLETNKTIKAREVILPSLIFLFKGWCVEWIYLIIYKLILL